MPSSINVHVAVRRLAAILAAAIIVGLTTASAPSPTAISADEVTPADFVDQLYLDLLDRPADASGREHWASQLASGASHGSVIESFIDSAEVGGAYEPVIRLYRASFLRPPDRQGLNFWVKSLRDGESLDQIAEVFATSTEFVNRYGSLSSAEFVDRVYRNVLLRAPDSDGLDHWVRQLSRGMSRGEMLLAFSDSPENVRQTSVSTRLSLLSITLLDTIPGSVQTERWDRRPETTTTAELIDEVLSSAAYQRRLATLFPHQRPLTGQYGPALVDRPALAVKVDNLDQARPQIGLNLTDVVYEEVVEGNLTRLIAVYHSQSPAVVGPVRSVRTSDLDVLAAYNNPLLAASGANTKVLRFLEAAPIVNVDALEVDEYWRSSARRAPHNLMTSPAGLWTHAPDGAGPPPVMFATSTTPTRGVPRPGGVAIDFGQATVGWSWSAADEVWRRTQNGAAHVDSAGRPIGAENVVILVVNYLSSPADAQSPEAQTVGRGSAVYFIDGERLGGFWQRDNATDPIELVNAAGEPVVLRPGQTWVELAPPGSVQLR